MKKNGVLSVVLIAIGIIMILGQFMDIELGDTVWTWWPMALVIGGLYYLSNPRDTLYSGLLLLGAGVAFQLEKLDISSSFWSLFFPYLLIVLGIYFALGSKNRKTRPQAKQKHDTEYKRGNRVSEERETTQDYYSEHHDISAVFSSAEKKIDDQNFSYSSINSVMASCEVDMRSSKAAGDRVEIGLRAIMGNIEIMIPSNWRLVLKGTPILGNIEDKTRGSYPDDNRPTVECIVDFECIMGNIEIRD